MFFEIIMMK